MIEKIITVTKASLTFSLTWLGFYTESRPLLAGAPPSFWTQTWSLRCRPSAVSQSCLPSASSENYMWAKSMLSWESARLSLWCECVCVCVFWLIFQLCLQSNKLFGKNVICCIACICSLCIRSETCISEYSQLLHANGIETEIQLII